MAQRTNSDQLHGTLDLLVLRTLLAARQHGYGIAQRLHQLSDEVLQVEEGSLYPALYRMEQRGWIASEWAITDMNRRARFYKLTAAGRTVLGEQRSTWRTFAAAINRIAGTEEA